MKIGIKIGKNWVKFTNNCNEKIKEEIFGSFASSYSFSSKNNSNPLNGILKI